MVRPTPRGSRSWSSPGCNRDAVQVCPRSNTTSAMTIWLPEADWVSDLEARSTPDVELWREGMPVPSTIRDVTFYVPSYLGTDASFRIMELMPQLQVIQTLSAGYDDVLPLLPSGVTLCNARGVHDASTAELAVGLVLASLRGFGSFVRAQDRAAWQHVQRPALADKSVIVLGAGSIGQAVAARLAPFEVDVQQVARTARDGVIPVSLLPELLPKADVVIIAVPLTSATEYMVDKSFLGAMKDGALLVNISRGAAVVTDALLAELTAERLQAALDVTDPEPLPPDHPLWQAPNLLITPHVGGDTSAFLPRARRLVQGQVDRFLRGQPLINIVVAGSA